VCQIGVMPIFLAYTVFAVVYFGTTVPRFNNFQNALVALFSVLNGDVVRETFLVLIPKYVGRVCVCKHMIASVSGCHAQCFVSSLYYLRHSRIAPRLLSPCQVPGGGPDLHVHLHCAVHLRRAERVHCHH
jgi:hypothetical protein